jgi:hypothetical protein
VPSKSAMRIVRRSPNIFMSTDYLLPSNIRVTSFAQRSITPCHAP